MDKTELVKFWIDSAASDLSVCESLIYLLKVNDFHLQGRYPEEKSEFHKICTPEFARENFEAIKEFYQWLLTKF